MQSINNQILATIKKNGHGKIIFTKDFSLLGTEYAIRQSLYRLCKDGLLVRLAPPACNHSPMILKAAEVQHLDK